MLILAIGAGVMLKYLIYDPITSYLSPATTTYEKITLIFKATIIREIIFAIILLSILSLIIYLLVKRAQAIRKRREYEDHLRYEEGQVMKLIKEDLKGCDAELLRNFLEEFDKLRLSIETKEKLAADIKYKRIEAMNLLEKEQHNKELTRYERQKEELTENLQKIREEIKILRQERWDKKEQILEDLSAETSLLYEKDELGSDEVEALKEEDFEEINEYDPKTKMNKSFLVKKILNHSATHSFLVARIKEMLDEEPEITNVQLHETKDADITFKIRSKTYAIEVETGTLLSKKRQLHEKVVYLKNKYGQNWFFVVTHRDLVKRYKKFANVTPRSEVSKMIEKLAKN